MQPRRPTAKRTAATWAAGTWPASNRVITAITPKKSDDTAMIAVPLGRGFDTAGQPYAEAPVDSCKSRHNGGRERP